MDERVRTALRRTVTTEQNASQLPKELGKPRRFRHPIGWVGRWAVAAVFLVTAGYIAGRLSAPGPVDVEQLRFALEDSLKSSLEQAIRQELLEEVNHQWALALASNRVQFKTEVKQILMDLIRTIDVVKTQDRRWIEEALYQMKLNRLQDKTQFRNGLEALAIGTDNKLLRTKKDMAKLLVYAQLVDLVPEESESPITPNERSKE